MMDIECVDVDVDDESVAGDLLKVDMAVQTCSYLYEQFLWEKFNDSSLGVRLCSLCMEPFNLDTEHRIASLKCGHFFGENCIRSLFDLMKKKKIEKNDDDDEEKSNGGGSGQRCPICGEPSRKPDIRTIYSKFLIAIDKTDEQQIQEEASKENDLLQTAIEEKNNANVNLKLFKEQLRSLMVRRRDLDTKILKLKSKKHPLISRKNFR
ncbi:E3 ubiquitin-protein ligase RFWD3-like [Panonychus citri]|uniref:E3 ubiquitin-protein ligase RFWD3-like n=1 Tax=Panonychus citri TaxID=50023 RepID=UPI002307BE33|nr:E3 ubiquitin-protein ligase RFWD3-like [Panonychus citri]